MLRTQRARPDAGERCNPPVGQLRRFTFLDSDEPVGSYDLTGFEVLSCGGPDDVVKATGFSIGEDDSRKATLLNKNGKVVSTVETGGSGNNYCTSKKHRVVVVQIHEGLGGDCQEVGGYTYRALRY